jgi:hypothetical protein
VTTNDNTRASFVGKPLRTASGGEVWINPGTGPVEGATEANATANVEAFINGLGLESGAVTAERQPSEDSNGRFGYLLRYQGRDCAVEMPGLPLEEVEFLGGPDQNPWDYPRLYVDGNSWLWCYGLNVARECLAGEGGDE